MWAQAPALDPRHPQFFFSQTPRWDALIFAAGVSEDPLCHVLGTSGSFYLRSSGLFLLPEVSFWDQSWWSCRQFLFFFFSHKAYGILVPRPGIKVVSPALEVQSPNCWTPREVPRGQVLFVFVSALPKSSHRVLLSGVPSSASWLHLATKAFPDCPPAFFLFLGICFFFPPGQLKSLSLYLEFMVFPRYVQMWIFPLLLASSFDVLWKKCQEEEVWSYSARPHLNQRPWMNSVLHCGILGMTYLQHRCQNY